MHELTIVTIIPVLTIKTYRGWDSNEVQIKTAEF